MYRTFGYAEVFCRGTDSGAVVYDVSCQAHGPLLDVGPQYHHSRLIVNGKIYVAAARNMCGSVRRRGTRRKSDRRLSRRLKVCK